MRIKYASLLCLLGWVGFMGCQPADRNVSPQNNTDRNRPASEYNSTNSPTTNDLTRPGQPDAGNPR